MEAVAIWELLLDSPVEHGGLELIRDLSGFLG
jgi:hypothetical protein